MRTIEICEQSSVRRYVATARFVRDEFQSGSVCFTATARDAWPGDGEENVPCLLWCSGHWHCANAGWSDQQEEETRLKVGILVGGPLEYFRRTC